ncbi:MAG TPA: metal ABC transporter substrate-binding protein [Solirubrobacterales bacterium]|jgi:ABC-type Zn uptake system ZnuABC Zn-binding protein ZnuA
MVFAALVIAGVSACGGEDSASAGLRVVASTTHVADLARNVAGERADVEGVLPPNADPHGYEPRPADAEALLDADLVITSGGDLDLWMDELYEASGSDGARLALIEAVDTLSAPHDHEHGHEHAGEDEEGADEGIDPHWWHDPGAARDAVAAIRDELIAIDPEGAPIYRANAKRYSERIAALDRRIAGCFERIPPSQRKLVTTHDSLAYFAEHYGLQVVGAALPALTTQAQPSAGQVADLVDLIRAEGVRAVFAEAGLSADLERAIADEAGARVGGELWTDTLGPSGSGAETYLDALAANARTIAAGLSGSAGACAL